jgi:hypothetical protein
MTRGQRFAFGKALLSRIKDLGFDSGEARNKASGKDSGKAWMTWSQSDHHDSGKATMTCELCPHHDIFQMKMN